MREFFKGWRRKAGVVTLLMACVVMVMWLRSRSWYDVVEVSLSGHRHRFGSLQVELIWLSWPATKSGPTRWVSGRVANPDVMLNDSNVSLFRSVAQHARYGMPSIVGQKQSAVPYWPFTIPLTLLAAYLILWKPGE